MKILFIYKLFDYIAREPLGMLYVSAALKKAGHQTEVVDARSLRTIINTIEKFGPDILAYPIIRTGFHHYYLELNKKIKQDFKVLSLLGGPHPTYFPEIIEEEGVDGICRGEGEQAMVELVNRLEKGISIAETQNWWIKENGKIYQNPVRALEEEIDKIPFPDRDLIFKFDALRTFPTKSFISGRGCPYNCTYCFNESFKNLYQNKGKMIRRRSVENLIEEICLVKEQSPLRFIFFEDDMFLLEDFTWLAEFSQRYKECVDLPFHCIARVEYINPETVRFLKTAGCTSIALGIESGNIEIRERILNRKMTNEQILLASKLVKKNGIKLITENIIGIPGGTIEDDLQTLRLNIKCQTDYALAHICQPYPKTKICQISQDLGLYPKETKFDSLRSYYARSPLTIAHRLEVDNLARLFAFGVNFPFIAPLIPFLIKLRLKSLYTTIYKTWKVYSARLRLVKIRMNLSNYIYSLRYFVSKQF
jgi:radical SAM superfamily enzyme YgiQ (UPF0313 family)